MGSYESNMTNINGANEFKSQECPNIPSFTDYPPDSDPLRHFLKHKTEHEVKVKTLSDVQKKANKRFSDSCQANHHDNLIDVKKDNGTLVDEGHNGFFALIPTVPKISESKENNLNGLDKKSMNESKTEVRQAKKLDLKNSFRKVTINPESFIKVRS